MPVPSDQDQVRFLLNVQRLLGEGQFTATYKYALLLALADLAVERGTDTGDSLTVSSLQIAEKFVEYYWRQVVPYPAAGGRGEGLLLRQNTDRQAAVIRLVERARVDCGDSLPAFRSRKAQWQRLVREVARVVRVMPLWKLQIVGRTVFDFLYENAGAGTTITLRPGVAYCLRQFHGMITELVRSGWVRYIRQQNLTALGETADLHEFLFGSERTMLGPVREVLRAVDGEQCFYCHRPLQQAADVDHFIPWLVYPVDLGHNFVLAHKSCNSAKSSRLPAGDHLSAWVRRNLDHGAVLGREFDRVGMANRLEASLRIAEWAYTRVESAAGLTWRNGEVLVPLTRDWREKLGGARG